MQTNHDEQVIYLKDLLFSVLYRWKKILVWCLILAALLGGFKGVSAYRDMKSALAQLSDPAQQQQTMELYESEKTSLEDQMQTLQDNIQRQTDYLQASILMQLNPYAFYEATVSVYISTDYQIQPNKTYQDPDLTNALINGYTTVLTGDASMQAIADEMGIEVMYLSELLTTSALPKDSALAGTNTLTLSFKYPTEEGAQQLLGLVSQQLSSIQDELADSIQEHEMHIIRQDVRQASDMLLMEEQNLQVQKLTDLYDKKDLLQIDIDALVMPQVPATSISSVIKSAVIFAVIGGVVGAVLAVLAIWIGHICSNKVYSARTLRNRTQLKTVGCINVMKKMGPVTKALRKLDNRCIAEASQQAQLVAASVRNLCEDSKHLLVTGTADSTVLMDALHQAMPGVQISGGNLLTDISAVEALSRCDRVLLVEQCGTSCYTDVQQTAAMIADNGKLLLGCVLLNG